MKPIFAVSILLAGAIAASGQNSGNPPAAAPVVGTVTTSAGPASSGAVAPGSLASIFGTNLASNMATSDTVPLSTTLSNVSVMFNNLPAPVQFVSPSQITVQVPGATPTSDAAGPAQVVVTRDDGSVAAAFPVTIAASAPAIYNIGGQAIAVNSDGTLAAAASTVPGLPTHPAKIGDPGGLMILATGLGPVDQPIADGAASDDMLRNTLTQPTVLIGGVPAVVTFSGLSPQFPGVNQINVMIPAGTPTGNSVTLQIQINGTITSNPVKIAVSQ